MEERCVLTEGGGQIKWRGYEERKREEKRREEKTEDGKNGDVIPKAHRPRR